MTGIEAPRRIVVLGGSGAGKSTFARALGEREDLSVVHLDTLVFGPGWRETPLADARAALAERLAGDRWIVEGTYPQFNDLTLARADLVVWLEQPVLKRLWRSWRKTQRHRGRPREDRPDGCDEVFGPSYVAAVVGFGGWTPRVEAMVRDAAPSAGVVRLRGDREAAAFLSSRRPPAP